MTKYREHLAYYRGWSLGTALSMVLSQLGPCPWPIFVFMLVFWSFLELMWLKRPAP